MSVDFKRCPCCDETIRETAIKCRYCRRFLAQCEYCAEWIPFDVGTCPFCDETVVAKRSARQFSAFATPQALADGARSAIQGVRIVEGVMPRPQPLRTTETQTAVMEPNLEAGGRRSRLFMCAECSMLNPVTTNSCMRCGKHI
jgi:hypothetical protein